MTKTVLIKSIFLLLIIGLFYSQPVLFSPSLSAQEQERIVENVSVTNVEVPVRVLFKGQPVKDLVKEDFILYEDKKELEINGFFVKTKKITLADQGTGAVSPADQQPRSFVLVFNITDYNDSFKQAVEYLFTRVLRENDRVMIFANDKTLEFPNLKERDKIRQTLEEILKEESQKARARLIQYINQIETYLRMHDFRRDVESSSRSREGDTGQQAERIIDFLKKYLLAWNEYKKQYLTPKTDRFYFFSRYLEKLKGEKWVLSFYQFELFPRIRMGSDTMNKLRDISGVMVNSNNPAHNAMGRLMDSILNQLLLDININQNFNTEEITRLFYKVDATFHSFFIRSSNIAFSDDLEYRELSSDIEAVLKGITDVTGGQNITENNLEKALDQVRDIEDVYYLLTYVPRDPKKAGKLKIKCKRNSKYTILYDAQFRADYITEYFAKLEKKIQTPDVAVVDFSFKDKVLAFTVRDYLVTKVDNKNIGRIKIRIRVVNANNQSFFDQQKVFDADKKEMKISIGAFKNLPKGEYNFLIDAVDMFTGKEANFHESVPVKR